MLFPYNIDVPIYRRPYANFAILGLVCLFFVGMVVFYRGFFELFVLDGWSPLGLIGHMWLHVGLVHLIGNMIFLWTFGNAICAKVGNLAYVGLYLLLGLASGVAHNLFDMSPAVGASGAINGIVGMCLVLYPVSDLKMFYWIFYSLGSFRIRAFWMIGLWFTFDIWGVVTASGGVAYWGHLGGFLAGVVIALVLLKLRVIRMVEYELSILDVLRPSGKQEAQAAVGSTPAADHRAAVAATTAPVGHRAAVAATTAPADHRTAVAATTAPRPRITASRGASAGPQAPSLPTTPTADSQVEPAPLAQISLTCHQCSTKMQAPPAFSGRRVKCPKCGAALQVP